MAASASSFGKFASPCQLSPKWNSKYWAEGWQKPDLTKVYCADQSGKANQGESGKAIQGALNWFIAPVRANYYTFTIDLEALTYTWTKLEDQNPAVYNQISLIGVGGDWGTDIDMEKSTAKEITAIVLPNGENIPTFDAYLKLVASKPNTRLILEMKSLSDYNREDLAAKKIVKQLKKYGVLDQTEIIAFSINACMAFKKLIPDTKIYYLNGDLAPKSIKKLGLAGIDYSMKVLRKNPEWVKQAHDLGLEVNVWTVDSEEDMKYFIGLGVDYITTDYPERLQALLK